MPYNLFVLLPLLVLLVSACSSFAPQKTQQSLQNGDPHTPPVTDTTPPLDPLAQHNALTQPAINPSQTDDVWQRIRMQLSFPHSMEQLVSNRVNWYLKRPNYMGTISQRAEPFLYYIVTEVERRGLPVELALMPLIESDFNTRAYSNKRASGLWQLSPLIAKHYGLEITPWYDGRHDIVESTNAALNFLTYLHQRFDGNWYHAIAAYNTGEGRIARAIKKNKKQGKSTDFFSLSIPKETRHYVPKLLAVAQLLRDQNMAFPAIDNTAKIEVVKKEGDYILTDSPQWEALSDLNPGYKRYPALINGPKHIVLRISQQQDWQHYIDKLPPISNKTWKEYTIRRGDSLSKIAYIYNVSISDLKKFNKLKSNKIRVGDKLTLPLLADKEMEYTVKSGDSLWRIANRFNVTIKNIKQWNNLSKNRLNIGDKLTIFLAAL